jgi:hypothetical protein
MEGRALGIWASLSRTGPEFGFRHSKLNKAIGKRETSHFFIESLLAACPSRCHHPAPEFRPSMLATAIVQPRSC